MIKININIYYLRRPCCFSQIETSLLIFYGKLILNRMADGCNLYFTKKDLEQVEKSLQTGNKPNEVKTARNILNGKVINNVDDFKAILSNPNDTRHKIVQQLLEKSLSHGQLTRDDEFKLSKALKAVLNIQKNLQGLFENPPKHRGPGADSMKHGGELLTTAAIIQKGGIYTSLGNKLYIDKTTDIIGFGQKLPAKYALPARKKGTIEADTLIVRDKGGLLGSFDVIGIDTKYSKTSSTYGYYDGLDRQLKGIQNSFRDGSIQEFYFVSNVQFSERFKERVQDYNIKILKDRLSSDREMRNNFGRYLSEDEKDTYIPQEYEKFDFYKKPEELKKATKEYHVPQIGLCEQVTFES